MSSQITYAESDLIFLLKSRDERAYNYLYDNYAAALYGVIIRVVNAEEAAQDVLQEVFVKIWRNMESYDANKGRLFTWMLNIARNTAIDAIRSKSYKNDQKIRELGNDVNLNASSLTVNMKTDHIGLQKILEQLSEEQRMLIDLAYFKGYTQDEISKELEIPLGTVKTRIRNALLRLRDLLK